MAEAGYQVDKGIKGAAALCECDCLTSASLDCLTKCSYRSFVYKTNALTDHMILHRAVILTLFERGAFGTWVGTTSHFFVLFI